MGYCNNCGFGIGSQGHKDCCMTKTATYTRNGNRINMREVDYEFEETIQREEQEQSRQEFAENYENNRLD